ncbi:LAQU0S21e00474g1_1 [Lachancea quebecensis]|uniref:LAQU0S21e00474g1_1 n=1 Tax=Lachancea quebecensis TaxID=1654605 RepID=A0A0P1KZG8_9SACH|nr:LAQU0S21e00474g1_1 [Lachancea quebecensis]
MSNSLEERLRINSNAFDGLLSLIPAKYYYDDKTQDQWKAKKKTKAQTKLDKLKKLDPEQQNEESASALEVMEAREKNGKPAVIPGQKPSPEQEQASSDEEEKSAGEDEDASETGDNAGQEQAEPKGPVNSKVEGEGENGLKGEEDDEDSIDVIFDDEGNKVRVQPESSDKPAAEVASGAEDQPATPAGSKTTKKQNLEKLRAKLQEKIQAMKEKRRAPGTQVTGALSSREAILAQRKRKDELKRKRTEQSTNKEEDSSDESNSGSDVEAESETAPKKRRVDDEIAKDLMFQNIVFDDGSRATSDLQRLRKAREKKGPSKNDIKAHLNATEAKRAKLEAKDELVQIQHKEKEKWQRAMLQAEGERMRDDEKLLRKALKRKEARKRKSSVEWRERKEAVATAISDKQKRREENLQIRRDNKGKKGSHREKMKRGIKGVAPVKKRAGFEGRLKSGKKK